MWDVTKLAEKMMSMDDESWQRHANPWSVYLRFSLLPLITLAFYSREWVGAYSWIFIVLSFVWVWINPRLFNAPKKTNNWASMGTFGERVYLNRQSIPISPHHRKAALVLQILSGLGVPIFVYGLYSLDLWTLALGNLWIMICKAWFVDRMVWLYLDMKDVSDEYQQWLKS